MKFTKGRSRLVGYGGGLPPALFDVILIWGYLANPFWGTYLHRIFDNGAGDALGLNVVVNSEACIAASRFPTTVNSGYVDSLY